MVRQELLFLEVVLLELGRVNFHLDALRQLGAKINLKNGYIEASAKKASWKQD